VKKGANVGCGFTATTHASLTWISAKSIRARAFFCAWSAVAHSAGMSASSAAACSSGGPELVLGAQGIDLPLQPLAAR